MADLATSPTPRLPPNYGVTGVGSTEITDLSIVDADIVADAAIAISKLASLARGSAFTQTYATASHTHANPTALAVATTAATAVASFGYAEAQANAIVTAVNALIADIANIKQVLNGLLDDLQTTPAIVN